MKTFENAAAAVEAFNAATNNALNAGENAHGAAGTIAAALIVELQEGNGCKVFEAKDEKGTFAVNLTPELLLKYARGGMAKKREDADADTPTSNMLLRAVTASAPAVVAKYEERAKAAEIVADESETHAQRDRARARKDKADAALNGLKTPFRNAFMIAAYVFGKEDKTGAKSFDPSTVATENGSLFVQRYPEDVEHKPDLELISVATARALFSAKKGTKAAAKPKAEDKPERVETSVTDTGVSISMEALRSGGDDRKKLSVAIQTLADMFEKLDTDPSMREAEAMARLYVTLEGFIDADRIAAARDALADAETA